MSCVKGKEKEGSVVLFILQPPCSFHTPCMYILHSTLTFPSLTWIIHNPHRQLSYGKFPSLITIQPISPHLNQSTSPRSTAHPYIQTVHVNHSQNQPFPPPHQVTSPLPRLSSFSSHPKNRTCSLHNPTLKASPHQNPLPHLIWGLSKRTAKTTQIRT